MERKPLKTPVMVEYWLGDETKRRETEQGQNKLKQEETTQDNPDFTEEGSSSSLLEEVQDVFLSRSSEIQFSGASYYLKKSQKIPEFFFRGNFTHSQGLSLLSGERFPKIPEMMHGTPLQKFITEILPRIGAFVPVSQFFFHQSDQPKAFSLTEKFFRMSNADKAVAISPGAPKSGGIIEVSLTATTFEENIYTLLKSPYPLEYKEFVDVSLSSSDPITMTNTLMIGNDKREFKDIEVLIIRRQREASAPQSLQFLIIMNIEIPEVHSIPRTTTALSAGPSSTVSNIVPPPTPESYAIREIPHLSEPSPLNNSITEAASSSPKNV